MDPWIGERARLLQRLASLEQTSEAQRLYVLEKLRVLRAQMVPMVEAGNDDWCSLDATLMQMQAELHRG